MSLIPASTLAAIRKTKATNKATRVATTATYGTPAPTPARRAKVDAKAAHRAQLAQIQKSYKSAGLSPAQGKDATTVLGVGQSMGASKKELLAAAETGLVESHFSRPNELESDGTSAGWRQETAQARYGSEARRLKPKPTAKDYFSETAAAGRGKGTTAGQLAQHVQGSAYPDRYDAIKPQGKAVLRAFLARGGAVASRSPRPGDSATPFATTHPRGNPAKKITPKWDRAPDGHTTTVIAKGIAPTVKKWAHKYNVTIGATYDPAGGHESLGHTTTGTATDVYPKENSEAGWDELEKGLAVLGGEGFQVFYDGAAGTEALAGHGRGNHAHINWVHYSENKTDPKALQRLGNMTGAQVRKLQNSTGGGGGSAPWSGGGGSFSSTSSAGSSGGGTSRTKDKKAPTAQRRMKQLEGIYGSMQASSAAVTQATGRKGRTPVI